MMDTFRQVSLLQLPRLLGLCDRSEDSKTYGCFDRNYWHYKLIDFGNARMQEAVLCLAVAYNSNFPENIYYKNKKVLEWIKAGINYWASIQNGDGSFNEAYPFERGFCVTAFSSYAASEAILILKEEISIDSRLKQKIEKTGNWLSKNTNPDVSNQEIAAAVALLNISKITQDKAFLENSNKKIGGVVERFNRLGYLPEYGGFDIGYTTISLSLLCKYNSRNEIKQVKKIIEKETAKLENALDEYGNYGYGKMSRKTQFAYPSGFAYSKKDKALKKIDNGLKNNKVLSPVWMDDRYFIQMTTDYIECYLYLSNKR